MLCTRVVAEQPTNINNFNYKIMKFIELQKRFGGKIILNAEHISSIETYRFIYKNGDTSSFTSIHLSNGKCIEVVECDDYIIELIQKSL